MTKKETVPGDNSDNSNNKIKRVKGRSTKREGGTEDQVRRIGDSCRPLDRNEQDGVRMALTGPFPLRAYSR